MFTDDTIAAISTPLGEGGIGIVRLSGNGSLEIAEKIFFSPKNKSLKDLKSFRVSYGYIKHPSTGEKIDEVLVTVMRSPRSYTKEEVVEISCHGGMMTLRKVLEVVLQQGARLAEPGEFTKRAFINGRLDLSQAEAVIDLIRSRTDESRRISLEQLQGKLSENITGLRDGLADICANVEAYIDFPEDEIETPAKHEFLESMKNIREKLQLLLKSYDEGRFFREGLSTVIVGKPNVGKSSLLNALLKRERAIVTEIPGTTRDVIEEYLNVNGLPLRLMDTAGIREVKDIVEKEGVKRSLKSIENADLIIALFDQSEPLGDEDLEVLEKIRDRKAIIVLNKSDLQSGFDKGIFPSQFSPNASNIVRISATRGDGLEELKETVFNACLMDWKEGREGVIVTNIRHKTSIGNALISLEKAELALIKNQPFEILALELRDSMDKLGEIVGIVTTEDLLNKIFSDFCIGK
jgi:tRNA modification GTPase